MFITLNTIRQSASTQRTQQVIFCQKKKKGITAIVFYDFEEYGKRHLVSQLYITIRPIKKPCLIENLFLS